MKYITTKAAATGKEISSCYKDYGQCRPPHGLFYTHCQQLNEDLIAFGKSVVKQLLLQTQPLLTECKA